MNQISGRGTNERINPRSQYQRWYNGDLIGSEILGGYKSTGTMLCLLLLSILIRDVEACRSISLPADG